MGAFKLGKMTFGSLFKKPETILYPFESKPQPEGLKGHIVIDAEQCILCGMCDKSCTTNCITVDKKERYWEINPFGCIQCGYCVTVCPKKCLHMDPNYWPASSEQGAERFTVPVQEKAKPAEKKTERAADGAKSRTATLGDDAVSKAKTEPLNVTEHASVPNDEPTTTSPEDFKRDAQLVSLIANLDPAKARIVESALAGR